MKDLLQDLFIKALRQSKRFCSVNNARAWLFVVARNTLADRLRVARHAFELPEDLPNEGEKLSTVDALMVRLPRVSAVL